MPQSESFLNRLQRAIELEFPYSGSARPLLSSGRGSRQASVLILWSDHETDARVLLTKRTEKVETHKGQMAFPGGMQDPEDASLIATALRETHEEMGISPSEVRVLGTLPPLPTVTGFLVTPVVGVLRSPLERLLVVPSEDEIADFLWVEKSRLSQTYRREAIAQGQVRFPSDVFLEEPHRVWGFTGALLKNLLDRLEQLERLG